MAGGSLTSRDGRRWQQPGVRPPVLRPRERDWMLWRRTFWVRLWIAEELGDWIDRRLLLRVWRLLYRLGCFWNRLEAGKSERMNGVRKRMELRFMVRGWNENDVKLERNGFVQDEGKHTTIFPTMPSSWASTSIVALSVSWVYGMGCGGLVE